MSLTAKLLKIMTYLELLITTILYDHIITWSFRIVIYNKELFP